MAVRKARKTVKRRTVRRVIRQKTVKRNPQKTFRARGKVVSFFAKRNPGKYCVVKFSGPSDVEGKVLSRHNTLAAAQKAHKDIVMPGKDLIPGYLNYGITESTAKANPRRKKTVKRTSKRVRRNPLPPRNSKGRFMKRKSNPRKRRVTKRR